MNNYYSKLSQAFADSVDCVKKCNKGTDLFWEYYNKQVLYTDSMNYYYEQAHPKYREKEAKQWAMFLEHERTKCNCKPSPNTVK
jgi:hypothetical protein